MQDGEGDQPMAVTGLNSWRERKAVVRLAMAGTSQKVGGRMAAGWNPVLGLVDREA